MEPTVGRIVHFHFHDRQGNFVTRPAMIVKVYSQEQVNLQVFTDGDADGADCGTGLWHRTQVIRHEQPRAGFWSWPPRV